VGVFEGAGEGVEAWFKESGHKKRAPEMCAAESD